MCQKHVGFRNGPTRDNVVVSTSAQATGLYMACVDRGNTAVELERVRARGSRQVRYRNLAHLRVKVVPASVDPRVGHRL